MYLEAKETARLYQLLSEKLGTETTEVLFKYIDNKTERSVQANIKSLATKDDIGQMLTQLIDIKIDTIKWMFIFWAGQFSATVAAVVILLKK